MADIIGRTIWDLDTSRGVLQPGFSTDEPLPEGKVATDDVSGGMVVDLPRDKRPINSFLLVRNARTRDGWVGRRPGTAQFGGTKPNSYPVTRLVTFITDVGDSYLVRFTGFTIHVRGGSSWLNVPVTEWEGSIEGNRINLAHFLDRLVIANGQDKLSYLDFGGLVHHVLDDSPKAKFITTFAERVIAANIKDPLEGISPNKIKWCVNADFFDWTGLGAGEENLVQSPSDFSDEITGIFGLENEMVILRRRSIWHATRQPFAQAPFRFIPVIAGFGCDLPYTAVRGEGVIFYADQFTKGVYVYAPGNRPQKISVGKIEKELLTDLQNLEWAEASYDPYEQEYHLGLSTTPGSKWISRVWVYSVKTQSWSYDDSPTVSTIGVVSTPGSFITINELVGTIDELEGTINELGGEIPLLTPALFKGTATGEVLRQAYPTSTDWNGVVYLFELQSQNLGATTQVRTMQELVFKVMTLANANYSVSNANQSRVWRNTKNGTVLADGTEKLARLTKSVEGRDIWWSLVFSSGLPRLSGWWARFLEKGRQVR